MLSCKEIARLVSESLDRELPFRQRLAVRMHLFMCRFCWRFQRQMRFLREAAQCYYSAATDKDVLPVAVLSEEAKERIKRTLEREQI